MVRDPCGSANPVDPESVREIVLQYFHSTRDRVIAQAGGNAFCPDGLAGKANLQVADSAVRR